MYKPDAFYSTATQRTKETLAPWQSKAVVELQIYDAARQNEFAKQLLESPDKMIVVVGHSNTIPQLVNLILGRKSYTDIPDDEFGRVWIITIRNGKATAVVKEY